MILEKAFIYELLSKPDSIKEVINYFNAEFLTDLDARTIFQMVKDLYECGEQINYRTIAKETGISILKLREYKNESSIFNIKEISTKIINTYSWNKFTNLYKNIENKNAFALIDNLQGEIDKLHDQLYGLKKQEKSFSELLDESIEDLKNVINLDNTEGLNITSLPSMNNIIGGIMPPDLIGIYGVEKSSKSTLSHEIIMNLGVDQRIPCGIISYEVWHKQLIHKSISMRLGYDMIKLRNPKGNFNDYTIAELENQVKKLGAGKNVYFCDDILDEKQIYVKIKRWKRLYGIRLIVLDHLLLIPCSRRYKQKRDELNYLTRFFKLTAKELEVPIILISQANESGERGAEAKGLERDSDYFFSIHPLEKGQHVKITNSRGIEVNYSAGENQYVVKNKGMRYGFSGRSFITFFSENRYRELNID